LTELGLAIFQKKLSQADAAINPYQDQIDELMGDTQSVILARLAEGENISLEDPLFDLYSNLTDMCLLTASASDTFRCLEQQDQNGQLFAIQLVCLDPGPVLQPLFVAFDRVLLFSATLKPFDFYRNMDGALVLYHQLSTALAIAKTGKVREHLNSL
jgi:Rad3-related DNA helicase